jgi:hypothetical protein
MRRYDDDARAAEIVEAIRMVVVFTLFAAATFFAGYEILQ